MGFLARVSLRLPGKAARDRTDDYALLLLIDQEVGTPFVL